MKAIVYEHSGPSSVLQLREGATPEPAADEVRVRILISGVNPTDWKARASSSPAAPQIPNQDGAGVIDAIGADVTGFVVGERVWIWDAAYQRSQGTAQELALVPAAQVVPLPAEVSFEVGASLGIPALTAHRALTSHEGGPSRLAPGALDGHVVLVTGGAGAVSHAAIQLARWADATVIATVSSPAKAQLAAAAGADHVVDYRTQDVVREVHKIVPHGVDVVVEVDVAHNAETDAEVIGRHGAVAIYAADADSRMALPVRSQMTANSRWQFVLVYAEPERAKGYGVEDVNAAVQVGAVRVGREAGLPLHVFPLAETAAAHEAVEQGAVGKVLVDVTA